MADGEAMDFVSGRIERVEHRVVTDPEAITIAAGQDPDDLAETFGLFYGQQ